MAPFCFSAPCPCRTSTAGGTGLAIDCALFEAAATASVNPSRNASLPAGDDETLVIPVHAEKVTLGTRVVERGGVRIDRQVEQHVERVDPVLVRTKVDVERRVLNQLLDGPPPSTRQEGEVLVIPVLEEVAVVQTRWLLKEELRIRQRVQEYHAPQDVVLKHERVTVERFDDASGPESDPPLPPTSKEQP